MTATNCAGCDHKLVEDRQFTCASCDETYCLEHRIQYNGEEACPNCALYWAQQDKRTLDRLFEEHMQYRMEGSAR